MNSVREMTSHTYVHIYVHIYALSLNISPTDGSDSLLTVLGGFSCLGVLRGTSEAGEPHSTVCRDPGGIIGGLGNAAS